ncbi:PEP/pyruvate-binding domain-containing protein [Microbacterium kunmingense]|uniref:PEP/pyruvate-binding domain-containing protein n=1 Tax=Microbacterium kunmingense TaxID=2915939 RepID=UPI002002FEA4|nr:PEP/pyruvate-binding domain-containing protein [Microbacterium kunmingense]
MSEQIIWLTPSTPPDPAVLGGKGVGLVRLIGLEAPVPSAFVVTTGAYLDHIRRTGLDERIVAISSGAESVDEQARASQEIEELFLSTPLSPELADSLREAYGRYDGAPVAVRSSATAEDTAEASFAGQQESYLWVRGGDSVVEHVAKVWASLFTPQAIAYRVKNGVDVREVSMAVVVQEMVESSVAGVMLTLNPTTGDASEIYVEATYGLGLGLVSGEVTPDSFGVDRVTLGFRTKAVGSKEKAYQLDSEADEVVLRIVSDEDRAVACVTDDEALAIARMGKSVDERLGSRQDIEWALGPGEPGARELFLLQTRPETVWSNRVATKRTRGATPVDRILSMMQTPMRLHD